LRELVLAPFLITLVSDTFKSGMFVLRRILQSTNKAKIKYSGPNVVTAGKKMDHLNQMSTLQQFGTLQG
jgi:hypothetical protein